MHLKKSELQIGEETSGLSSDFNPSPLNFLSPIQQKHLRFHKQNHSTPHDNINYTSTQYPNQFNPPTPSLSSLKFKSSPTHNRNPIKLKTQFQNEPISSNPSTIKTLISIPHKRHINIISQNPSTISHSVMNSDCSSHPSLRCCSSFAVALATKTVTLRHFRHFCCVRLIQIRLRFIVLLCLPSLCVFTSNHNRAFLVDILSVLAFSAALLISLNLAIPRLPSIRLFLARSFPVKLTPKTTPSEPNPPVVWSIGSNPKSEIRVNSGIWVQVYKNGDVYEGEFHKGKCSGSGVYYYHLSGKYEGDWVDEKYDGYGVETWAKGSRYRGQYRQGLRHGVGVYRFFAGDVYAGEWSNGQSHGCGVHTCEDGSRYVGEFKRGVKHGFGHYHFRNGDAYAGEYFADKIHGFGVYRFGNGHLYEGAWHEGRRQGLGMYTFRNGDTQSGHWQNGVVLNVSSTQETLGGSPFSVNNPKVLNAVQEARRAAEKAFDVGKMDERVNKAVAAANKAANAARVAAVKAVQNRIHHNNNNNDTWNPNV